MKIPDAQRFLDDRQRFSLAHTCERCVYHDRERDGCAHGYPDGLHREAIFTGERVGEAMFCKEFELE